MKSNRGRRTVAVDNVRIRNGGTDPYLFILFQPHVCAQRLDRCERWESDKERFLCISDHDAERYCRVAVDDVVVRFEVLHGCNVDVAEMAELA